MSPLGTGLFISHPSGLNESRRNTGATLHPTARKSRASGTPDSVPKDGAPTAIYEGQTNAESLGHPPRFISPDPLKFSSGDINVYRYADDDPIDLIDPLGLATVQLGGTISINFLGFFNFQYSGGILVDTHGNFGIYNTYGGAGAFGNFGLNNLGNLAPSHILPFGPIPEPPSVHGALGLSLGFSNAQNICDVGGPFVNGSVGAGEGADVSVDGFAGPSNDGPVVGGGVTVGVGAGEGGSVGVTQTTITPLAGRKAHVGCH